MRTRPRCINAVAWSQAPKHRGAGERLGAPQPLMHKRDMRGRARSGLFIASPSVSTLTALVRVGSNAASEQKENKRSKRRRYLLKTISQAASAYRTRRVEPFSNDLYPLTRLSSCDYEIRSSKSVPHEAAASRAHHSAACATHSRTSLSLRVCSFRDACLGSTLNVWAPVAEDACSIAPFSADSTCHAEAIPSATERCVG